jgi:hypothetical protein
VTSSDVMGVGQEPYGRSVIVTPTR